MLYNIKDEVNSSKKEVRKMPRQIPLKRIRRCRNCQAKTHQRFWREERCPICNSGIGYSFSIHGGLTEKEINEMKIKKIKKR